METFYVLYFTLDDLMTSYQFVFITHRTLYRTTVRPTVGHVTLILPCPGWEGMARSHRNEEGQF